MKLTVLQLGELGANCYIVADEQTQVCAIVDPGGQGEDLADWLEGQGLKPRMVLLTHGHYDHVGGTRALADRYPGMPIYLHPGDTGLTPDMCRGLYWTASYEDGDTVTLDSITFRVLHTPGHTPGSVCLQAGDALLTGDTLFAGSCGRTDFPGGSWQDMMASLRRLAALPGNPAVLPGHGGQSDLDTERAANPYLKEASKR